MMNTLCSVVASLLIEHALIVGGIGASLNSRRYFEQSQPPPRNIQPSTENLKRCLDQLLLAKTFSGVVLVANRSGIQLQSAYGPGITAQTRFYIASISKQFTAAAIMKLAEQNRLRVDDEISRYLSNVPADKAHITIHQLLTHTSGLPQMYAADGVTDREKAVRAVLAETLKNLPGKVFGYTNDGYSLLAAIVEIVAGVPFESFIRQNLLEPPGLTDTGFWGEPIKAGAPIAPTLRKSNYPEPNWGFRGATGMFSTAGDLYKWTRALLEYRVLSRGSTIQMLRGYVSTSAGDYGYGWFTSKTPQGVEDVWTAGYEDFGHNGIINAYETGDLSVVLTNSGDISGRPARELASKTIESSLQSDSNCSSPSAEPNPSPKPASESGTSGAAQRLTTGPVHLDVGALSLKKVKAEVVRYRGKRAIHISPRAGNAENGGPLLAILQGSNFKDGTIELSIAGAPAKDAPPEGRGFVGIAFRIDSIADGFEYVYLRPTNGRADDQVRRNHSTQYASFPDYPFDRLRKEEPEKYESYVDVEPGQWTRFKLVVNGNKASLYINGSSQPCLVINDLKRGDGRGAIGFWIGLWTDGYFSDLRVTPQ